MNSSPLQNELIDDRKLRILLLEDSPADTELIEAELKKNDLKYSLRRVMTKNAFTNEIRSFDPDIILSDYKLPSFDGYSALLLAKKEVPHIPFVLVTGAVGDETAVECIKAGAEDYVLKDHLHRLVPAMKSALGKYKTQQSLEASQSQVSNILESITDGFVAFDAQMNYTYVNNRGGEMLGRKPEDLIGKNYWKEYPEAEGTPFANAYVRALKEQTPIQIEDYYEPFDRWFENRIYPSKDGLTIFFTEITERKKAEEEIRRERDLTKKIMETSPTAIVIVGRDGNITYANTRAEEVLGLSKDDIKQRDYKAPSWRITDFNGQPFPDEQLPFRQVATTKQPVYGVQHAIEWTDGKRILLSINAAPLFTNSGEFDGMVATLDDITERKRA